MDSELVYNYIYILREREFIKTNEHVYKIGKTNRKPFDRLKGYPKGTKLEFMISVDDCNIREIMVKNNFNELYKKRTDIGQEYYEGDLNSMKNTIFMLCNQINNTSSIDPSTFEQDVKILLKNLKDSCKLISDPILQPLKYKLRDYTILKDNDEYFQDKYEEIIWQISEELNKKAVKIVLSTVLKIDLLNHIVNKLKIIVKQIWDDM